MAPDSAHPLAVTPEKMQVLAALAGGPLSASLVGERTNIAKTSLSRILDELAADGKVRKGDVDAVPGRAGRRPVLWELTPVGDTDPVGAPDDPGPDGISPDAMIAPGAVASPHDNDAEPSTDTGEPISVADPPEAHEAQAPGLDDADPAGTVDPDPDPVPDAAPDRNAMPDADPHDPADPTSTDPGVDTGTPPDVAPADPARSGDGDGAAGGEATVEEKADGEEHDGGTGGTDGTDGAAGQPDPAADTGGGGVCAAVTCPLAACPVRTGNTPVSPARRRARPTAAAPKANQDGSRRLAPGELGRQIAALLRDHPQARLTVGEIARELGGRSSGAVAAAMPKLVNSGQVNAVNPGARPARFQTAPVTAGPGQA